jgi:hypothetical protein
MRARMIVGSVGLAVAGLMVAAASAQRGPEANLAALQWLNGSWTGTVEGLATEEHWSAADGGLMTGMHRDLRGGRVRAFEFLRIQEREGSLVYIALPAGRNETEFALKSIGATEVVFENLAHDFPQRVIYRRSGDSLTARVEGTVDGKLEFQEWTWKRGTLAP